MPLSNAVTILLIEDDEGHAMLVQINLIDAGLSNPIRHLPNGSAALAYIQQLQARHDSTPVVVLLDLNLPEIDGFTILAQLKSSPKTRKIPVIILTSTDDPGEVNRCYELGCNLFLCKPVDYLSFTHTIRQLGSFLSVIEVPDTN